MKGNFILLIAAAVVVVAVAYVAYSGSAGRAGELLVPTNEDGILRPLPDIPEVRDKPAIYMCTDSDGGGDGQYYEYGAVVGLDPDDRQNAQPRGFLDSCVDSATLKEHYCVADWAHATNFSCPAGQVCSSGKCAPEEQKPHPSEYCCDASLETCTIRSTIEGGRCEHNGQVGVINCIMREGQNMTLHVDAGHPDDAGGLPEKCKINLSVENNGTMGYLRPWLTYNTKVTVNGSLKNVSEKTLYSALDFAYANDNEVTVGNILGNEISAMDQTTGQGIGMVFAQRNVVNAGNIEIILDEKGYGASGIHVAHSVGNTINVKNITVNSKNAQGILINCSDDTYAKWCPDIPNAVTAENIIVTGAGSYGVDLYATYSPIIKAKSINATNLGIDAHITKDGLVCADEIKGGGGQCRSSGDSSIMACENGRPIEGCNSGGKSCNDC